MLADFPPGQRSARFRCVVALAAPSGILHTAAGVCEGEIGLAPRGQFGFGYDPVFIVQGYGGRTLAELSAEEKNQVSHRARAVMALRPFLLQLLAADQEQPPLWG